MEEGCPNGLDTGNIGLVQETSLHHAKAVSTSAPLEEFGFQCRRPTHILKIFG